jgi:NADP-dependent 3-hydroxy acid dehydrogenase YdfG
MQKTILITGASRGFGNIWAKAFLKRGDHVIATARNLKHIENLVEEFGDAVLPLQLDVTRRDQCFEVVEKAYQHFQKLDVVINNAGYGLFGAIEETSEQEVRDQFDTNVFGSLWITQAAIPIMKKQGKGHIIQVSSILGLSVAPTMGIYSASKWAVEAINESMAGEVKAFGISTTLIEPNRYDTEWAGLSAVHSEKIADYDGLKSAVFSQIQKLPSGDPKATAEAILKIADAATPPLRVFFGKVGLPWVKNVYAERLSLWEQWSELSEAAQG